MPYYGKRLDLIVISPHVDVPFNGGELPNDD